MSSSDAVFRAAQKSIVNLSQYLGSDVVQQEFRDLQKQTGNPSFNYLTDASFNDSATLKDMLPWMIALCQPCVKDVLIKYAINYAFELNTVKRIVKERAEFFL